MYESKYVSYKDRCNGFITLISDNDKSLNREKELRELRAKKFEALRIAEVKKEADKKRYKRNKLKADSRKREKELKAKTRVYSTYKLENKVLRESVTTIGLYYFRIYIDEGCYSKKDFMSITGISKSYLGLLINKYKSVTVNGYDCRFVKCNKNSNANRTYKITLPDGTVKSGLTAPEAEATTGTNKYYLNKIALSSCVYRDFKVEFDK